MSQEVGKRLFLHTWRKEESSTAAESQFFVQIIQTYRFRKHDDLFLWLAAVVTGLVEALLDTLSQATGGANFVDEIKEMRQLNPESAFMFCSRCAFVPGPHHISISSLSNLKPWRRWCPTRRPAPSTGQSAWSNRTGAGLAVGVRKLSTCWLHCVGAALAKQPLASSRPVWMRSLAGSWCLKLDS